MNYMPHRNCRLLIVLSIFSTIRTRRMGLWFFSSTILAHHLCSPIRSSRMGSRRNGTGPMKVAEYRTKGVGNDKASCRWNPGLPTTKRTAPLLIRPPTGFMPVDARFENFADLLPVSLTQDRP